MANDPKTKAPSADDKTGSTAHEKVPGKLDQPAVGNPDGSMPMGMTGGSNPGGDPDQKSTHNAPNTVESNLPDGSPKFMDRRVADASRERARKARAYGGRFKVKSPIRVAIGEPDSMTGRRPSKHYEVGDIVELSELDAESLKAHLEPLDD